MENNELFKHAKFTLLMLSYNNMCLISESVKHTVLEISRL